MSTYKRRIVYLSDPEWEHLARLAKERKATISATIRSMLTSPAETVAPRSVSPQAKRDELLRKINRR